MKLNKKQIITIIVVGLIIASVGFNIYICGTKIADKIYKEGLQQGAINITNQIRTGININYEDGAIKFVPSQ